MKVVYIAGPITDTPNYKDNFNRAEQYIKSQGYIVVNPSILPEGFKWEQYMPVCYAMMDWCDGIYLLRGWSKSKGSCMEYEYADARHMRIMFEREGEQNIRVK